MDGVLDVRSIAWPSALFLAALSWLSAGCDSSCVLLSVSFFLKIVLDSFWRVAGALLRVTQAIALGSPRFARVLSGPNF
jgi:hypothetical protein